MTQINIFDKLLEQLVLYINQLNWAYILTYILMAYAIKEITKSNPVIRKLSKYVHLQWWSLLCGVLYGFLFVFLWGYDIRKVLWLLQSLIFAIAFEKIIVTKLANLLKSNSHSHKL